MGTLTDKRKTKIVGTIGPASSSPETLRRLIRAGLNVARLNFSHGDHQSHLKTLNDIRAASKELGRPVGVLQDLAGPKIRLGVLRQEKVKLKPGREIKLASGEKSSWDDCLPVNYEHLYEDVEVGERILLADGQVELMCLEKKDDVLVCQVVVGGVLTSHKGVNLPGSDLRIPAFTDKDRDDLRFGLDHAVDFVAMSFVRHERDLTPLREMMAEMDDPPLLIAKVEKPQAVENFADILRVVDGVMVARGDLGVEVPLEEVPLIQKQLIRDTRRAGKVVITATQMLRSMVDNPRPTRAEVTDVANAVLDGTDAVMLSEESAMGQYPVDAVKVLDRVCRYTEPKIDYLTFLEEPLSELLPATEGALSRAANTLALDLKPAAIVANTASGGTARLIARYRPPTPIVGMTAVERTLNQLTLSWGVFPETICKCETVDEVFDQVSRWARETGVAGDRDKLIVTAGIPLSVEGTTNLVKVIDMAIDGDY